MKSNLLSLLVILISFSAADIWAEEASSACTTAKDDIARLEEQKKSEGGILSYTPIGLIASAGASDEKKEEKKVVKTDNDKIDAQIDAIKKSCNIE